jgi:hypothetical protein
MVQHSVTGAAIPAPESETTEPYEFLRKSKPQQ